jgi:hypothetical protein
MGDDNSDNNAHSHTLIPPPQVRTTVSRVDAAEAFLQQREQASNALSALTAQRFVQRILRKRRKQNRNREPEEEPEPSTSDSNLRRIMMAAIEEEHKSLQNAGVYGNK